MSFWPSFLGCVRVARDQFSEVIDDRSRRLKLVTMTTFLLVCITTALVVALYARQNSIERAVNARLGQYVRRMTTPPLHADQSPVPFSPIRSYY
jgi:hypothetical protein